MRKNFKIAFLSLIISFTILFPVSSFIAINVLKNNKQTNLYENKSKIKYNIPKTQDITILFVISNDLENEEKESIKSSYLNQTFDINTDEKYFVLKISAHNDTITFCELPTNLKTVAQTNDGFLIAEGTLEKIYKTAGINYLKKAIENIMKIEINNTIRLNTNAIYGIINNLGGIKIINNNKTIILETEKFIKILNKHPYEAIKLMKNSFNEKTNLSKFFITIANLCLTDISINEFETRKKGFEKMIEQKQTKIEEIPIKFNNSNKLTNQT